MVTNNTKKINKCMENYNFRNKPCLIESSFLNNLEKKKGGLKDGI